MQVLDEKCTIELADKMGDSLDIVNAARVSLNKISKEFGGKDKKLLKFLILMTHTSPLEACEFKFLISMPLFVLRQSGRHRSMSCLPDNPINEFDAFKYWSRNEVSRRYTSDEVDFYNIPADKWRKQDNRNKQGGYEYLNEEFGTVISNSAENSVLLSLETYKFLLREGVCREQARSILPQNMIVKFMAKVDGNNLLKYLILRVAMDAQEEIRKYAEAMISLTPSIKEVWQIAFGPDLLAYEHIYGILGVE